MTGKATNDDTTEVIGRNPGGSTQLTSTGSWIELDNSFRATDGYARDRQDEPQRHLPPIKQTTTGNGRTLHVPTLSPLQGEKVRHADKVHRQGTSRGRRTLASDMTPPEIEDPQLHEPLQLHWQIALTWIGSQTVGDHKIARRKRQRAR